MRIGVIDIGSNSIKLLVAESGSTVAALYHTTLETRISAGISKDQPVLSTAAIEAATRAVVRLIDEAKQYKPDSFAIVATSAVRDASNRDVFVDRVKDVTGHRLRVLTGTEEAAYIGRAITTDPALADHESFTLCDLGGGSLELVHLEKGIIKSKVSLQLGAVRLLEQFVKDPEAPIIDDTAQLIRAYVREKIQESGYTDLRRQKMLAATGGAVNVARAVRAAWLGQPYDKTSPQLSVDYIKFLKDELCTATLSNRQKIPEMPKERADIMPVACIILLSLAEIAKAEIFVHSLHSLRYGIAAALGDKG